MQPEPTPYAIFISYRRDDAGGEAGRLYDDLVRAFSSNTVFMDVAGIQPGKDFRLSIDQSVAQCGVLLAIIGRQWLTIPDSTGTRRLDNPNDFVRLEIASALARKIPVIPVLVQSASMPAPGALPGPIQDLAYRNGVELSLPRWNSDVALLVDALRSYVSFEPAPDKKIAHTPLLNQLRPPDATTRPARMSSALAWAIAGGAIAGVTALITAGIRQSHVRSDKPSASISSPMPPPNTGLTPANTGAAASPSPSANKPVAQPADRRPTTQYQVPLHFNTVGIYPDGAEFDPFVGIAGTNSAFHPFDSLLKPGTQLLTAPDGTVFHIGLFAANDVLQADDDEPTVIPLPAQRYRTLVILGAASPSSVPNASFYVNYGTKNELHSQGVSAFEATAKPRFPGEETLLTQDYANSFDGTKVRSHYVADSDKPVQIQNSLYIYRFKLDAEQPLKSLTLPQNHRILIFAITLLP